MEVRMAKAAKGVSNPINRAIPEAHIEKAERKHNQAGVFIAVDQVLRLRNFGQPWRMKQTPMKSRNSKRVASVKVDGPEGTRNSMTVRSITKVPMFFQGKHRLLMEP
jgi:hypothetical protein